MTQGASIQPKTLDQSKLLLVEGTDDKRFLAAMLKKLQIDNVQIEPYHGTDELLKILRILKKRPNFNMLSTIGITKDADDKSVENIFKTINTHLKENDFSRPSSLANFSNEGHPKIGVFVLPDCERTGELEELFIDALPNSEILQCINQFVECCKTNKHLIHKPAKTRFYTWLAVQKEPHLDLWVAGNRNYFDFDHIAFKKLRKFLEDLSTL